MIDEDELRRLLADAAAQVPPPGRAPDELLAALRDEAAVVRPRRFAAPPMRVLATVAAALLTVVVVGATLAGDGDDGDAIATASQDDSAGDSFEETGGTGGGGGAAMPSTTIAGFPDLAADLAVPEVGAPTMSGATASGGGGLAVVPDADAVPSAPVAPGLVDSSKVVKTGAVSLEVETGAFEGTVDAIITKAVGLGGHVAEQETFDADGQPSGRIVVRVPSESYEAYLGELRKLGDVAAESQKGTEVSAEYADVQAQLSALSATRDRLLTVLADAANVGDILAVQDRMTGVQTQIEMLQGRLRLLDDQVAFGTIAIDLAEPGADRIELRGDDDGGLSGAWRDARERFTDGLEGFVAWSGSAGVVLVIGGAFAALGLLVWRRARRWTL